MRLFPESFDQNKQQAYSQASCHLNQILLEMTAFLVFFSAFSHTLPPWVHGVRTETRAERNFQLYLVENALPALQKYLLTKNSPGLLLHSLRVHVPDLAWYSSNLE